MPTKMSSQHGNFEMNSMPGKGLNMGESPKNLNVDTQVNVVTPPSAPTPGAGMDGYGDSTLKGPGKMQTGGGMNVGGM